MRLSELIVFSVRLLTIGTNILVRASETKLMILGTRLPSEHFCDSVTFCFQL